MAVPITPIEIWAEGDVILPNTQEPNKNRPINDLWNKGWDWGEKPSVEEFNYVLNMISAWAKYITEEQIPNLDSRFLRQALNLSDLSNKATARTNLEVFSKDESDQRFVNLTGDTMTGTLSVPMIDLQGSSSDVAYITTTKPTDDQTFLDFVVGDNPGNVGDATIDSMRFRFSPTGSNIFTMLELNALNNTAALARLTGNMVVSGSVQAASINAPSGSFTNLSVSNTATVGTLQSTTTRATNIVASNNVNTQSLDVTAGAQIGSLNVVNNNAVVAGRNIVRSINGVTADSNGNVGLTIATTNAGVSGNTGWWRDNNTGIIFQWTCGSYRGYNNEQYETIYFPIAFPNACLSVNTGTQYAAETIKTDCWGAVAGFNSQYARVQMQWAGDQGAWETGARCMIFAMGY